MSDSTPPSSPDRRKADIPKGFASADDFLEMRMAKAQRQKAAVGPKSTIMFKAAWAGIILFMFGVGLNIPVLIALGFVVFLAGYIFHRKATSRKGMFFYKQADDDTDKP